MTIFNGCSTSRGLKMHVHESTIQYVLHTPLLLWCLTQLAGWDAMATVVAENIKKAWEMKDTLCAGIVARTCALRWKSQNLFLSYRQRGGGEVACCAHDIGENDVILHHLQCNNNTSRMNLQDWFWFWFGKQCRMKLWRNKFGLYSAKTGHKCDIPFKSMP